MFFEMQFIGFVSEKVKFKVTVIIFDVSSSVCVPFNMPMSIKRFNRYSYG